jgi:ketosteroid isomerase-like protein
MGTESGQATLAGESVAFSQRVTNIYRREGGTWELVHHHTDVSPVMAEMVTRLQAGSTA